MRSSAEAVAYARTLHALVIWLGICDGNMQEGSFRCDANVSVRRPGAPFGTRREIKNLNSFRFMQQAIDYEVQWQIDLIEDGGTVQQATVLFDAEHGETRAMRSKEDAHDYRYFPDPDLPPLAISAEWIARVRAAMPELPKRHGRALRARLLRSAPTTRRMMTESRDVAAYFEAAAAASARAQARRQLDDGRDLAPHERGRAGDDPACRRETLATLIARIADRTISNAAARQVFDALWQGEGDDVDALIEAKGLRSMRDAGELERIVDAVIAGNAEIGRGVPRRQGQGVQRARRPGDEGEPRARPIRREVSALLRTKLG